MKKKIPRILACFMACLIAVNAFAIPKAKAVAVESVTISFAPAILAAYAQATGVSLTAASAAGVSGGAASILSGYAAATGSTYNVVTTAIAAGATVSTSGVIILSVGAVALLAGITAWLISEYQLKANAPPTTIANTHDVFLDDGTPIAIPMVDPNSSASELYHSGAFMFNPDETYTFQSGYVFSPVTEVSYNKYGLYVTKPDGTTTQINLCTDSSTDPIAYFCTQDVYNDGPSEYVDFHMFDGKYLYSGNGATFDTAFGMGNYTGAELSASLKEDYEPKPEVQEGNEVVINTGLSVTSLDELPGAIFNSISGNEFAPTYDEQPATDSQPDGEQTSPDTGLQTGLLTRIAVACEGVLAKIKEVVSQLNLLQPILNAFSSLAESIHNALNSLGEFILNGIEALFVPDEALISEMTSTFNSKFGFVSDLHNLMTAMLFIISGVETEPPQLSVDLSAADGFLNYGGECLVLDMSWYEPYKPLGDSLIGAYLVLKFVMRLFRNVPSIFGISASDSSYLDE